MVRCVDSCTASKWRLHQNRSRRLANTPLHQFRNSTSRTYQSALGRIWNAAQKVSQIHGRRAVGRHRIPPQRLRRGGGRSLRGGAPRSESKIFMIAGGNHTLTNAFARSAPLSRLLCPLSCSAARKWVPRKGSGEHCRKGMHQNKKVGGRLPFTWLKPRVKET